MEKFLALAAVVLLWLAVTLTVLFYAAIAILADVADVAFPALVVMFAAYLLGKSPFSRI